MRRSSSWRSPARRAEERDLRAGEAAAGNGHDRDLMDGAILIAIAFALGIAFGYGSDRLAARFGESSLFAVDAMGRAVRYLERAREPRLAAQMSERMKRAQRGAS